MVKCRECRGLYIFVFAQKASVTEIHVVFSGPFSRDWPTAQISGPAGEGGGTAQQSVDGPLQQDHPQSGPGRGVPTSFVLALLDPSVIPVLGLALTES